MITILYAYRNRELSRIKRSIDSLRSQKIQNFTVIFVDYGSDLQIADQVASLLEEYSFVEYHYVNTVHQPWNKCKAFNYILKNLAADYCFTADVDMIFHPEFTAVLEQNCSPNKVTFFQVGYLSQEETNKNNIDFEDFSLKFLSTHEATGMSLFPVEWLKGICGFDEFFHFWGAEDTDIHQRLKAAGCEIVFYNQEVLMLHQWHPNYRSRETQQLNKELQLDRIVEINHNHLKYNLRNKKVKVNAEVWGEVLSQSKHIELECYNQEVVMINKKDIIDHFLFVELPNFKNGILAVQFVEDTFQKSLKYKIKKSLGKKVPQYYTLKEVNDKLLLHIISFYHHFSYSFKIGPNLKSIMFKIEK